MGVYEYPESYDKKRSQHYLAQFYQERFYNNGGVAVYDRKDQQYRLQQASGTAQESHLYTFRATEDGKRRYDLENFLADREGVAKTIITEKIDHKLALTKSERFAISYFVALSSLRTPKRIEEIRKLRATGVAPISTEGFATVEETMETIRPMFGYMQEPILVMKARQIYKQIHEFKDSIDNPEDWRAMDGPGYSLLIAHKFVNPLFYRDWIVLLAPPRKSFITSDDPVAKVGGGFGNADEIYFPLSASQMLYMHRRSLERQFYYRIAEESHVNQINDLIAKNSRRFFIGRDEKLLRAIVNRCGI